MDDVHRLPSAVSSVDEGHEDAGAADKVPEVGYQSLDSSRSFVAVEVRFDRCCDMSLLKNYSSWLVEIQIVMN